jgi:putative tricarboxylic transport membrane protein
MNNEQQGPGEQPVATRWPELLTALGLLALGLVVVADSLRIGAGWADDGPKSGYFPFYVGLMLCGAAAWIAVSQLRHWRQVQVFADKSQLRSVAKILWPMVVYVALIKPLGIYVCSAALIVYFMARHGQHRWYSTAAVAIGVPLFFFAVFERWFLVALPKGPIEALLGF